MVIILLCHMTMFPLRRKGIKLAGHVLVTHSITEQVMVATATGV